MSENTPVETKAQETSNTQASTVSRESVSVRLNLSQAINICAIGLGICFFLPWITIWGMGASGFEFAKQSGKALVLWSIPIFCAITIFATVTKRSPKIIGQLTGALPFFVLAYGLYHEKELLKIVAFGGWISLILGLALFILPRRLK
ncbi:MAG: hypothetical protein ACK4UN_08725 [Limisphaerales bacterium]